MLYFGATVKLCYGRAYQPRGSEIGEIEGLVRKHVKLPFGAQDRRPSLAAVRTRLRSAVTPKAAGFGVSAGGVGASLTAIATHQASTAAIAAVAATVVVGFVTRCVETYFRHGRGNIEARGKVVKDKIDAEARAQSRKVRDETQQKLAFMAASDPAKAPTIERLLVLQHLAALADACELTGDDAYAIGTLLANYGRGELPEQNPPADEGGQIPWAV